MSKQAQDNNISTESDLAFSCCLWQKWPLADSKVCQVILRLLILSIVIVLAGCTPTDLEARVSALEQRNRPWIEITTYNSDSMWIERKLKGTTVDELFEPEPVELEQGER